MTIERTSLVIGASGLTNDAHLVFRGAEEAMRTVIDDLRHLVHGGQQHYRGGRFDLRIVFEDGQEYLALYRSPDHDPVMTRLCRFVFTYAIAVQSDSDTIAQVIANADVVGLIERDHLRGSLIAVTPLAWNVTEVLGDRLLALDWEQFMTVALRALQGETTADVLASLQVS